MSNVTVSMKMTAKQAGAMYVELNNLKIKARELIHWCENAESIQDGVKMLQTLDELKVLAK